MSKVLRIQDGGYKIITKSGSEIKLDTGESQGKVTITGDLFVKGNTTYFDVADLRIEDNIIVLNKNESGTGITHPDHQAGIMIERGTLPDVQFFFDEAIQHFNPSLGLHGETANGTYVLKNTNGDLIGLKINSIKTDGNDLNFDIGSDGVLMVYPTGDTDYKSRVGNINSIPNVDYLRKYVAAEAGNALIEKLYRYQSLGEGVFRQTGTGIQALDTQADDLFTRLEFSVSDLQTTNRKIKTIVDNSGLLVGDTSPSTAPRIRINGAGISTENTSLESGNIFKIAPSDGLVNIESQLTFKQLPALQTNPAVINGRTLIYTRREEKTGGTGIYYTKQASAGETVSTGELISATKALVYGLIF
jgi:hypothetical protein